MLFIFVSIIAWLAQHAIAEVQEQPFEINVGNNQILGLMRELDLALKAGEDEKAAELRIALREAFQHGRPSGNAGMYWDIECSVESYLDGEVFVIQDPNYTPKEIEWALDYLDKYWTTDDGGDYPYPGDFDSFKYDGHYRVIRVDYEDLPWAVKKWRLEELEKNSIESKFIAVLDGVAFFSPGVVRWLQPLFAAKDVVPGENSCEDELVDFQNFHGQRPQSSGDVKYESSYGGRSQVGTTIRVRTVAQKMVRYQIPERQEHAHTEKDEL